MREKQGVDFDPEIYDPDNERAVQMREEYSLIAVERLIKFLQTDGDVEIVDYERWQYSMLPMQKVNSGRL
jgi:hypothetical protein